VVAYIGLYNVDRISLPVVSLLPKGRHASVDEITACALNAIELDKKHGDEAVQVRVTMGKEPTHFLAIFKGKLIIYEVTWLCAGGQWKVRAVVEWQWLEK